MHCVLQLLKTAAASGDLVAVALNTHGTRAVQKLIETLTNKEQVQRLLLLPAWQAQGTAFAPGDVLAQERQHATVAGLGV